MTTEAGNARKIAQLKAHGEGYDDRIAGKPRNPGVRTGKVLAMYYSGYIQACDNIILGKEQAA